MIPYFDLTRQYKTLQAEIEETICRVAASGQYVLGSAVETFEHTFAEYCHQKYGVGVGSGTDALIFSLKALGIGKGDEVIVPSFTFIATVFSVIHAGATPVFAEVNPDTYTLDPKSVEKALSARTRAILPVHLYGQCADMTGLGAIAKKKKLKIVEDACQAHGARWQGKKSGGFGEAGCFSYYPTKNLGALGDGGMTVTSDQELALVMKRLRNLGRIAIKDNTEAVAWTSRLDALQASVLQIKLKKLDSFNQKRRDVAAAYTKALAGTPLILPQEAKGAHHVYHLYVVRVPNGKRDELQKFLQGKGITTLVHYPVPVHRQPAVRKLCKEPVKLAVTDKLCQEILSLPMFPEMTGEEIGAVTGALRQFYK